MEIGIYFHFIAKYSLLNLPNINFSYSQLTVYQRTFHNQTFKKFKFDIYKMTDVKLINLTLSVKLFSIIQPELTINCVIHLLFFFY